MTKIKQDLGQLLEKASKALPVKAPAGMKAMLDIMADKITPDDVEFFDADILSQTAISHWEMAKNHKKGEPQISLYCPYSKESKCRKTAIDIVIDDMSFLVDSVIAEINRHNLLIAVVVHPYAYVSYDKAGVIKDVQPKAKDGYCRQSHIHVQINSKLSEEVGDALEKGLHQALNDVSCANDDWQEMLDKMQYAYRELAEAKTNRSDEEMQEHCAFLDFLHNNNFTLLGYREYKIAGGKGSRVKGSSLGLLRDSITPAYLDEKKEGFPRNVQNLKHALPTVSISKTNRLSTVHRSVPMDCISIKIYDDKGNVTGEKLFLGLFTSVTYSRSLSDVPYLRQKVEQVMEASGFIKGSHDSRALRHVLEKYPRDELFQIEAPELLKIAKNIVKLQERQRIALFMRKDLFGGYISCLAYIPRDRFGTDLRVNIQHILEEETGGVCTNYYTNMDDSVFTRVTYVISINNAIPPSIVLSRIEQRLREAGQTWPERLTQALVEAGHEEQEIVTYNERYASAFPVVYTIDFRARQCVFDIEKIEQAFEDGRVALDLYRPSDLEPERLRLKVFHLNKQIVLSDAMPILENMGLRVISEIPYEVKPADKDCSIWIHDFLLETPGVEGFVSIEAVKKYFERAFEKAWYKEVEDDELNQLVLGATANWHEIMILRAYVRYIKQLGFPFSLSYIAQALTAHPKAASVLICMFKAYHKPLNFDKSESLVNKCKKDMDEELSKVSSSDYDRILRAIMSVIEATVRTNYYQRQENGRAKPYLSIKLDSSKIPFMPKPVPFREIFVYSTRFEAVHLRGDKIARGGLRWSDRHEDFRTEVLGLMKAQMVKNSVIVPMGSKGGFVVKTPTNTREEFMKEGIECYKLFIRGLLDITDNQEGKKIIPPKGIIIRDGDDPYLVVAADKGTATFSDIANGLSQEYGFWLDDAFASGGSAGYDHKKMGITARGGWESVKFHFRLLGHDIQKQPFDVIGVGDMGGDVFGNGMLLSKQICLIGAFNHMHIFCDPKPDAVVTFKERKRLFKAVAGWGEYDTKLLSKGGQIYSRSDKSLNLTPQIKARFGIDKDKVTPEELINAMLKARTDLLWFGGIGTYVKASHETNAQAGDKANDALRVDASEVRARVIGEGANLGVTLLARVELAEHGVSMNTDFIDNSAGVDSSDHEVNIKILLSDVMSQKDHDMDIKARNILLESMTDEIAEHVLKHNYGQAQAISMMEVRAFESVQEHEAYIQYMERNQGLNRKLEGLPDTEVLQQRSREGKGLTRPELAVLLAYSKINLTKALLESDIPDNPKMNYWVLDYFPHVLGERFEKEILRHRLKREIIATRIASSFIDRMGPTFLQIVMEKTSAGVKEVMEAFLITRDAFGLRHLWNDVEANSSKIPAGAQLKVMHEISSLAERGILWFLTRLGRDMDIKNDVSEFRDGIKELVQNLESLTTNSLGTLLAERKKEAINSGLPDELAREISFIPALSSACDIIRMAKEYKIEIKEAARIYYEVGERFHVYWLRQKARLLPRENHWQAEAANGLLDQLYGSQAGITRRVLTDVSDQLGKLPNGKTLVDLWIDGHDTRFEQVDALCADLKHSNVLDLTVLTVAEQRLRSLHGA
jgi:glutamate dehydrogenase